MTLRQPTLGHGGNARFDEEVTIMMSGCDGSGPELIDPFGGPDEQDPDIYPDPTADDPPFGDEPEDDDEDDDDVI